MTFRITKYIKVVVLVVVTLSVVSSLTFLLNKKNNSLKASIFQKPEQAKVFVSASYPKYHPDLESLYKDADVVVLSEISKIMPTRKDDGLIFTDSEVNVIKNYKNPQDLSSIVIQQDGGTIYNVEYIPEDI